MANEVVKLRRGLVVYRVPGFQNFGLRKNELESEQFRRMMGDPEMPAKLGKTLKSSAKTLEDAGGRAKKSLEENREKNPALANLFESGMGELLKLLGDSLKDVDRKLQRVEPGRKNARAELPGKPAKPTSDPQLLEIQFDDELKWSDKVRANVDEFLDDWPTLRPKVLQAVFKAYRKAYDEIWASAGGEDYQKITLPDPTATNVIEDLFQIDAIQLNSKISVVGLTGFCTWEDEHGLGVRLKNGKVADVGYAEIVYDV